MTLYPCLRVLAVVERHHPKLPCFVTIPRSTVARWGIDRTATVSGTVNGTALGRRSLKKWDERRCWFLDLPATVCRKAGIEVGDRINLELNMAAEVLPAELDALLGSSRRAQQAWRRLTSSRQRMIREHVLAAKRPDTRERRAAALLGLAPEPRRRRRAMHHR